MLDEMYPARIAEQLRGRGHDVSAVTDRPELRSLADPDIFAAAQRETRTVVTENIRDFASLADGADHRGEVHFGAVFVRPARYPRGQQRMIGSLITALDRLLRDHPSDEPMSIRLWL
jgi:hypothetical protein